MNLKLLFVSMAGALVLTSAVHAADSAKATTKPVNSWTCEDFLAVDDDFQPTAVGFAEALNSKNKPEDAVLDISGIEKITPLVVQACEKDKTLSFKDRVRAEWAKIKKDL